MFIFDNKNKILTRRTCTSCGIYYPTLVALKSHTVVCRTLRVSDDPDDQESLSYAESDIDDLENLHYEFEPESVDDTTPQDVVQQPAAGSPPPPAPIINIFDRIQRHYEARSE